MAINYTRVFHPPQLRPVAWNPSDMSTGTALGALSNGNLTFTGANAGAQAAAVRSTTSHATGKFYFETRIDTLGTLSNTPYLGILGGAVSINTFAGNYGPFGTGNDRGVYQSSTSSPPPQYVTYEPGNNLQFVTTITVSGDVFGFAIDFTLGRMWMHKNGTYASGNPATNTSPSSTGISGTYLRLRCGGRLGCREGHRHRPLRP